MYRIVVKPRSDGSDVAETVWSGREFRAVSKNGASMALARQLVDAGAPDGEWQAVGEAGDVRFYGLSLHRLARLTITETDRQRGFCRWKPREWIPGAAVQEAA